MLIRGVLAKGKLINKIYEGVTTGFFMNVTTNALTMNKTTVFLLALAFILPAYGQQDKNVVYKVAVGEFGYTPQKTGKPSVGDVLIAVADAMSSGSTHSNQLPQYAGAVRASIVSGISCSWRLKATEDGLTQEDVDSNAPVLFADGYINNISSITKTDKGSDGKTHTYYRCLISVTVNLKDPKTGEVVDTQTFKVSEDDGSWIASVEKAMDDARSSLNRKVCNYYGHKYPWTGSIVEGASAKKDKQKDVYVDLGETHRMYKGAKLIVYSVKTVAGRESRSEIGMLKVEEVQGETLSLCKVTHGGDKIKQAIDAGETLIVTTNTK